MRFFAAASNDDASTSLSWLLERHFHFVFAVIAVAAIASQYAFVRVSLPAYIYNHLLPMAFIHVSKEISCPF